MAKKYDFKLAVCPSCGLDLSKEKGEKLVDGYGACPQCGRRLDLEEKPVKPSEPAA